MRFETLFLNVILLTLLLLSCGLAQSQSSDLKFHSVVSAVNQTDTAEGTITVSIHGLDVDVVVNGDTEIEESGEEIDLVSISAGDFVAISSYISDLGIVADEIHVLDTRIEQFRLRGFITATDTVAETTFVTLLGVEVTVDGDTKIVRRGTDNLLAPTELSVGDLANVRGTFKDGVLLVTRIHVTRQN